MAMDEDTLDPWAPPSLMTMRVGFLDTPRAHRLPHLVKKRQVSIYKTSGRLSPGMPAVVYVAGEDGRVKIGMTTNVERREAQIGARICFVLSVVPAAARDVESLALTKLGRSNLMPGEWVCATISDGIAALQSAWAQVSRYRRVDPTLTEEEARLARIAACVGASDALDGNP